MWWLLVACAPEAPERAPAAVEEADPIAPIGGLGSVGSQPRRAFAELYGMEPWDAGPLGDADGNGTDDLWTEGRVVLGPFSGEVDVDPLRRDVVPWWELVPGDTRAAWVRGAGDADGDGRIEVAVGGSGWHVVEHNPNDVELVHAGSALEIWADPFGPGRARRLRVSDEERSFGPIRPAHVFEGRDAWLVPSGLVVPSDLTGELSGAGLEAASLARIEGGGIAGAADLDGDGLDDVLASGTFDDGVSYGVATYLLTSPLPAVARVEDGVLLKGAGDVVTADLDGDGRSDLADPWRPSGLRAWFGPIVGEQGLDDRDADVRFTDEIDRIAASPDLDGDGAGDLVLADPHHGRDELQGRVVVISGAGVVGSVALEEAITWQAIGAEGELLGFGAWAVGDVDGNGVPDVGGYAYYRESTQGYYGGALLLFASE
jgi:hypothetical protein